MSQRGAHADASTDVGAFLKGLKQTRKDEVEALREVILAVHPGITERIK